MTWNIAPECTSLLFLLALIVYSRSRLTASNLRDNMFRAAEWVTLIAMTMNIASTLMIYAYQTVPVWATVAVTTAYFVFTPVIPLIYFFYVVILLHQNEGLARISRKWLLFALPYAAYLLLLLTNLWTHWVFRIDPERGYVQGSLIYGTYIVFYFYSFSVCLLAVQARRRIGRRMATVIVAFPLIAMVFIVVQKLFKDMILTGTASVFSLMLIFLYIQNNRLARDGLTGLLNREALLETVRRRMRLGEPFVLAAVSLDGFKAVNLRFGTRAGDEFLRAAGEFLCTLDRDKSAYRYSGDIFALFLRAGDEARFLDALRARFAEPFRVGGIDCRLSASVALVKHPESSSGDDPVSALDYALTQVKQEGGGKVLRYENALIEKKKRRRVIEDALRAALKEDGFYLHYQPVWSISKQKYTSAEALLRMRETPIGPVYPGEFIPVANDSGLIVPMTYRVLEAACRMCAALGEKLSSISVNFPFVQFMEPDLEARVMDILNRTGVSPDRIKIEITERVIIEENPNVHAFLETMSARGMRFCLDDFGIGYSNVEVMLRMPLDVIKLDRSLVLAGMRAPSHAAFLEKLVAGFAVMGRAMVAEGVETDEQLAFVQSCGCDQIQGFYFARPMSGEALMAFLKDQ